MECLFQGNRVTIVKTFWADSRATSPTKLSTATQLIHTKLTTDGPNNEKATRYGEQFKVKSLHFQSLRPTHKVDGTKQTIRCSRFISRGGISIRTKLVKVGRFP